MINCTLNYALPTCDPLDPIQVQSNAHWNSDRSNKDLDDHKGFKFFYRFKIRPAHHLNAFLTLAVYAFISQATTGVIKCLPTLYNTWRCVPYVISSTSIMRPSHRPAYTKTIVDLNWRHGHRSHDKYGHHTEIYRFLQLHPVETNRMAFQGLTLAGVLVRTNWKDIHLHPISRHIDNATISLSLRIERPRCIRSLETEAWSLKNPPFNVAECWRFIDADSITGIWMHALGYECVQCVHWDMNAFTVQSSNRVGPIKIGQWHWLSIACPKDFVT